MSTRASAPRLVTNTPSIRNARQVMQLAVTARAFYTKQRDNESAPGRRKDLTARIAETRVDYYTARIGLERLVRHANPDATEAQVQSALRSL